VVGFVGDNAAFALLVINQESVVLEMGLKNVAWCLNIEGARGKGGLETTGQREILAMGVWGKKVVRIEETTSFASIQGGTVVLAVIIQAANTTAILAHSPETLYQAEMRVYGYCRRPAIVKSHWELQLEYQCMVLTPEIRCRIGGEVVRTSRVVVIAESG
jgi:hypothetical protein